ncbi:hypothetical protein [Chelatococcus reniformis]|uniref:Uncharacterized protein n=1 Tax=Chelatococcus reniformis TaxID=1494448 RepID=A0A916UR69_9HYPH|nr:hypothetical protein [Chelatococcus reniformis]GGC83853.1 hypothetical protein GCM10010994_47170 [Chelatococcus reniformis]
MGTQATDRGRETREEKALDKSLEDTFPASDPSSVTRAPRQKRHTAKAPPTGADRTTPKTPR